VSAWFDSVTINAKFTLPTERVVDPGTTICAQGSDFVAGGMAVQVAGTLHGFLASDR